MCWLLPNLTDRFHYHHWIVVFIFQFLCKVCDSVRLVDCYYTAFAKRLVLRFMGSLDATPSKGDRNYCHNC